MKVSVITPTHNRPELLRQTIESFLMQDYEDKEMIIVNDYSDIEYRQKYDELYREYGMYEQDKKYINFHWNGNNLGISSTINHGIRKSTGDLITIISDDDKFYDNQSLSKRVSCFENDVEVIYTSVCEIDINNKIIATKISEEPNKDKILNTDYISIQSMMWRRNVHDKLGYFSEDLRNNEDWEWKIKCLMECNVKSFPKIISIKYRRWSGNKSIKYRDVTLECADKLIKRMREKYL